jgi:hypothetical protein
MAGYSYPMLARVVSGSGYSQTVPVDQFYLKTPPPFFNGAYTLDQRDVLLRERPELKFITLEQDHPLKVTLSSARGPTLDLTPYILNALNESPPK